MSDTLSPDECQTMADVRVGVDALDRAMVALLARRFAYMRAAARIKPDRDQVRDEPRKREVIDNVRREAERMGAPVDVAADLWDGLVEASIAYEMDHYDRLHGGTDLS